MEIKICNNCHRVLGINSFGWCTKKKNKRRPNCKRCARNQNQLWFENNPEYIKKKKQYRINNKERDSKYSKQYCKDNRDKVNAKTAKYRAKKLNQSPTLTPQENDKMLLYYKISDYMGPEWSVDHIIPMNKDGIHHPDNIQVTTVEENSRKKDRLDYTIPEELTIRI